MFTKDFFIRHKKIIYIELLLLIAVFGALLSLFSEGGTVSIAIVVPFESSEEAEKQGNDAISVLQVFADRENEQGGINGKKIKIQPYYDHGDPVIARKIAQEIVDENKFVAVLGHFSQATTQAAIDIYDKANIPLIAPISNIKTDSKWFFQLSPTPESYGIYMALYIKEVLLKNTVTIVSSKNQDDTELVDSFVMTFLKLGGTVEKKLMLDTTNLDSQISTVITNLEQESDTIDASDRMLLLMDKHQSIPLIIALKDQGIEIPIMSTDALLGERLSVYEEKNKKYVGFYSEGIYVPSMFLLDNTFPTMAFTIRAYEESKNKLISNIGLNVIESATIITKSLTGLKTNNINKIHEHLLTEIKKFGYFDIKRQSIEKKNFLYIGMFKQQQLITAPINPSVVDSNDVTQEQTAKLLNIYDYQLYPTDHVYVGIAMNKISNIDMDNYFYDLDFFLWFRYRDNVANPDDIEFLSTVEPTRLFDVLNKKAQPDKKLPDEKASVDSEGKMTATLVESNSFNGESYKLYRIKGRFKTINLKNYALGAQNLFVRFRHNSSNVYTLSYVSDFLNTNKGIFQLEGWRTSDLFDNGSLRLNHNYAFVDISHKMTLGNPEDIVKSSAFREFLAQYDIQPIFWSFRGIVAWINYKLSGREGKIDIALMVLLLSINCGILIFTLYGQRKQLFGKTEIYWWLLQFFVTFFILLFGELAISQIVFNFKDLIGDLYRPIMSYFGYTIAILWWLIPAYYIASAFERFLWQPIKNRTNTEIPYILRLLVTIFIYVLAVFGIMAYVLNVTIAGLAATSGIIAIIFAIASKVDLTNVIAGLAISFSKAFKLGDWVKIDAVEGKVIEMTPRSTKILTFNSSVVNIPNTTVSNAIVENYTHPDPVYRLLIQIEIVPVYHFERVEKILLDAVFSTEDVLDDPLPRVMFKGQGDSSQIYEVAFFIDDYEKHYALWQAAWRRIWRHLEQADILMATPQREIFLPKPTASNISFPLTIIENCAAFAELSDEYKAQLAQNIQTRYYHAGDIILHQGAANNGLFIITEGIVLFEEKLETGDIVEIQRLGVAEVFGQMSLLNRKMIDATVKAKTDTTLVEIKPENFGSIPHYSGYS